MDELIKLVSQKTGISEAMAKTAAETVIGYLKKKLPTPIAGQIDGVLNNTGMMDQAADMTKGLGGFLGKE